MGVNVTTKQTAPPQRAPAQRSLNQSSCAGCSAPSPMHRLQRGIGNRAVTSLLRSRTIQPKLTISQPTDKFEREADRVADQVMRMPDPKQQSLLQRKTGHGCCANCEEQLQRKTVVTAKMALPQISRKCSQCETDQDAPSMVQKVLRSTGTPLDRASRSFMEPRLGQNLSNVRIHTNAQAAESAAAINASAYTVGSHIVFAADRYRPQSSEGKRLLAHELTHVIQQNGHSAPDAMGGTDQSISRAWNECGGPDECPERIAGELTRARAATLQVGTLDAPEAGEIISHFGIGSSRVSGLARDPTWTTFVGVITSENSRWEILGFTDCKGDGESNTNLRRRRAEAVLNILPPAARAKIDRAIAAPLSDCVGINATEYERSLNRSVVFRRVSSEITFEPEQVEITLPRFLCGPDVTAQIADAIARTGAAFARWSSDDKEEVCDSLDSLTTGGFAWDIVELHNNAWIHQDYRPPCATAGATPACGSSIQVDNDCHYVGSANYVIFGKMCRLCADYFRSIPLINTGYARFTRSAMRQLIDIYKGTGVTGFATPSANFAKSVEWAEAGYDGWPGSSSPAGDRSNCTPRCPTPYTGRRFVVNWHPHMFGTGL